MKTTEAGGPRGYDAGKKSKGHKQHVATDAAGNLLDIKDHNGAPASHQRMPGKEPETATAHIDHLTIEIVKRAIA